MAHGRKYTHVENRKKHRSGGFDQNRFKSDIYPYDECVCVCKYMYRITFNVRVKRTCSPRSRSMNRVHAYEYGSVGCKYLFRRTPCKVKIVSSIPHTTVQSTLRVHIGNIIIILCFIIAIKLSRIHYNGTQLLANKIK